MGAQLVVYNSVSRIPYTLYTNAQNLLYVSKNTLPKSPVWCRNTAGYGHQMCFEWLKDYLSGVSFQVSLANIYSGKYHSRSLHIVTRKKGQKNGQRMFRRAMQVTTCSSWVADHVSRWHKQDDVSKNGDGNEVIRLVKKTNACLLHIYRSIVLENFVTLKK